LRKTSAESLVFVPHFRPSEGKRKGFGLKIFGRVRPAGLEPTTTRLEGALEESPENAPNVHVFLRLKGIRRSCVG